MRSGWMIALVAVALALPALAQQEPGAGQPQRPPADRARGQGAGFGSPIEMARQLAETLDLNDDQLAKYNIILAKFQPKFDEQTKQRGQMMELMQQMREARQNGDDAKVEELRQRMQQQREAGQALMNQFCGEVQPILTPAQVTKLNEFRDRMQRGPGGPGGPGGMMQMIQRLPEELKLTEAQRPQFDKLVAEYRAQQQELQPLMQELRRARQQGDDARVAELDKQIQEKRGGEDGNVFFAKLEPILTDEQKAKLVELRARMGARGGADDVRVLLQVAGRLDLNEEQQKRLQEIRRDVMRSNQGNLTPEKRAELAKTTKSQILAMLDAKQAAEFEQQLQRGQRPDRGQRQGPNQGPGRPGPGAGGPGGDSPKQP